MIVETFPVGLLQCNCTILGDEATHEAMVVDPGDDPDAILARLAKHGLQQCNCTILGDEATHEAMIVDPGDDPDAILARLAKHGLQLKQIVITHTHIDHVGAIYELQEKSGTAAVIHKADLLLLDNLEVQAQWIGMQAPKRGAIDRY